MLFNASVQAAWFAYDVTLQVVTVMQPSLAGGTADKGGPVLAAAVRCFFAAGGPAARLLCVPVLPDGLAFLGPGCG